MGRLTATGWAVFSGLTMTAMPALAQDFDEIIVTGAKAHTVGEAVVGVSVLADEELKDRLSGTIGETLKHEPGVSSTFFGPGASRPIIRGQGGDRVRVLTNGIGSIDASSASPDHAVAAEPAQAERIEVLRGAALLRFGSSGSGGIVNVIDGRIHSDTVEGPEASLRIGGSSVDNGFELAGAVNLPVGDNLVLHIDGTKRDTADYSIPGFSESAVLHALEEEEDEDLEHNEEEAFGTVENSFSESRSGTFGASYVGERGFFGVALHRTETDYGVPGGHGHGEEEDHDVEEHDEEGHDEDGHGEEEEEAGVTIGLKQTRLDANGEIELDGFLESVQFFGGYADYEHTEFEGPGVVGTVFANKGWEARLETSQRERDGWHATHGIHLRERDFSAIGEEAFVPPTKTQQFAAYTFHEYERDALHLDGALRYEIVDQGNATTGQSRNFDLISISAGADYEIFDDIRFGGTAFRTERAPTTEELFSNGPHLATSQFELGNAALGKETALGAELALRYRGNDRLAIFNVFYTDYNNYVFEQRTGGMEDGLDVFQFQGEDATFKGFEFQAQSPLAELGSFIVTGDVLAEYVRAKTKSGNLPRIPPLNVLGGIALDNDSWKFRGELEYVAAQKKLAAGELPTESHIQANLLGAWTVSSYSADIRLSLAVNNLFDVDARQHSSFLKDLIPLPGRNVRFTVSSEF